LDTTLLLDVDLRGLDAAEDGGHWQVVSEVLQLNLPDSHTDTAPRRMCRWVMFDPDNAQSILNCVNRARNNARSIRGFLGPEVWRAINKLYWQLKDTEFETRARESPHDFFEVVEAGSHLFQGVCDATLPHDEGWQFLQLGKYLERADKTLRILAAKYQRLSTLKEIADGPIARLEWASVLKACRSFEAFQRVYISRVEQARVLEFILLQPELPRSIRFCFESLSRGLAGIDGREFGLGDSVLDKTLGRALGDLRYADLDQLLKGDLNAFLAGMLSRCHQVSRGIQERYALLA
jgi:uncharacterized alpha-E superfamily protein